MNCCIPDFACDDDNPIPSSSGFQSRKIPDSMEEDLMELLWRNGPVLRRISPDFPHADSAISCLTDPPAAAKGLSPPNYGAAASTVAAGKLFMEEEDEMASWLHYPLGDEDYGGGEGDFDGGDFQDPIPVAAAQPPLPPDVKGKFAFASRPKEATRSAAMRPTLATNESTVVGSSVTPDLGTAHAPRESRVCSGEAGRGDAGTCEHGLSSADVAALHTNEKKRKSHEGDESEGQSEDGEFDFVDRKKDARRSSKKKKRTRSAEVHNLSERRRRDRINEKMKTLQQLIPRCNKSDKASMLDDVIVYLRSLQMQVLGLLLLRIFSSAHGNTYGNTCVMEHIEFGILTNNVVV